jgi:hypothetical protein
MSCYRALLTAVTPRLPALAYLHATCLSVGVLQRRVTCCSVLRRGRRWIRYSRSAAFAWFRFASIVTGPLAHELFVPVFDHLVGRRQHFACFRPVSFGFPNAPGGFAMMMPLTSAPGLGSPRPRLCRDGRGLPHQRLHRDFAPGRHGTGPPPTYTRYLADSSDDDDETLVALAEELGECGAPESPFRTKPQGLVLHGSHSVTVEKRCHYRVLQSTAQYHRGVSFT